MFQRIVVGVDGSERALRALDAAIELARLSGGTLHVVTVSSPKVADDIERMRLRLPEEFRDVWDPYADDHSHLAQAMARVEEAGVAGHSHEMTGDPAEVLLELADDVDADMVVVGSRGLGVAKGLFLGSVSTKLAHHCRRHLLIVQDGQAV